MTVFSDLLDTISSYAWSGAARADLFRQWLPPLDWQALLTGFLTGLAFVAAVITIGYVRATRRTRR